ncbi:MAG: hypothetical protein Q7T55_24335 [Solirubrobacteraceae bacterium]|nr:hypothetical protein [Solirubrobacteraceae bacterium]
MELDFADGTTWSFIWQTIRPWEGLLAFEGTLIGNEIVPDSECKTWSIDHIPAWARLIGSAITSVDSGWEDYGEAQSPFAWAIHFEHSNQVVIALGDVDDHYGFTPSADNVAVFFSLDSAHRHGLEPTPPST